VPCVLQGEDDGTALVPVRQYLDDRENEKPLGVYALYDSTKNLQYVGYGRNIILSIKVKDLDLQVLFNSFVSSPGR